MTAEDNSRALRVEDIIFSAELPEFPASSENGTAYVIDVTHMNEEQRGIIEDGVCVVGIFRAFFLTCSEQVAYSTASIGEVDVASKCAFLQNTPIRRTNFRCTGVKHCEYLDPEIRRLHHTDAENALEVIKRCREENCQSDMRVRANAYVTCC